MAGKHGGLQLGAGRPKGSLNAETIKKEIARQQLREQVRAELAEMTAAQIAQARGLKYLVYRDRKNDKWTRVTPEMLEKGELQDELIEVWDKEPSVQSYVYLVNRTLDKPADHVELSGNDGSPLVLRWER
jgi:hypothetical protein